MDTDTVTDTGGSLPVVGNFNKYFDECNIIKIIQRQFCQRNTTHLDKVIFNVELTFLRYGTT
jgi:hypothetical protein